MLRGEEVVILGDGESSAKAEALLDYPPLDQLEDTFGAALLWYLEDGAVADRLEEPAVVGE